MRNMLIASTSTIFGGSFLEYLLPQIKLLFTKCDKLLFIPYARPGGISYKAYTEIISNSMKQIGIEVLGIHEFSDPKKAIENSDAIYIGGGNTFVLLDELIKRDLLPVLRSVIESGTPYMGSSAGSNIVGPTVKTTNDMPIVHPASLNSLNLLPFNINPHYLDPDPGSKHKGETRATRIKEFHSQNTEIVVGLREGSWIAVKGNSMILRGNYSARIFQKDKTPFEIKSGVDLQSLLSRRFR